MLSLERTQDQFPRGWAWGSLESRPESSNMLKELDKDVLGWEPNQERNESPEDWMNTDAPLAGQTS